MPIWTTSTGRNNGLGGGSPRVKGAIVMNLRRMNRILEINDDLAYAVVEPGVTWTQLSEALRAGGHRLMVSTTDLGWGSVIGNSLEHGTTYMPYGADFMAPCGMEVVLANGEVLRTGMGAMPNSKAWHLYKRGLGPTLDPLFMQSNFGVVVQDGRLADAVPGGLRPGLGELPARDRPDPAHGHPAEPAAGPHHRGRPQPLQHGRAGVPPGQRTRWYTGDGPTPDHIIDQMASDLGVGRWTLHAALWDDKKIADYKIEKITAAL